MKMNLPGLDSMELIPLLRNWCRFPTVDNAVFPAAEGSCGGVGCEAWEKRSRFDLAGSTTAARRSPSPAQQAAAAAQPPISFKTGLNGDFCRFPILGMSAMPLPVFGSRNRFSVDFGQPPHHRQES